MNQKIETSLIDGQFSAADALELMAKLYQSKIQFHETKNFSSVVKKGQKDIHAIARIEALNASLEKIVSTILLAEKNHQPVRIHSTITIEILNHEPTTVI